MRHAFSQYKITYTLIAINLLVYLVSSLLSRNLSEMDMEVLVHMGALFGPFTVVDAQWWRLLTAMFLHGGMTHILMNMFSLYIVGRGVERFFDAKSYVVIYFFSGLIGGLVSLYMHPASVGVGASGAIFGIFGAIAGFFVAHRSHIEAQTKVFMKEFAIVIGINLVIGFSIPGIDVSAHVGGLVVGFIGGYLISVNPRSIWSYSIAMLVVMGIIMGYLPTQYAIGHF